MQATKIFSNDIHMECGLDKCSNIVLKKGKLDHSQNLILDIKRSTAAWTGGNIQVPMELGSEESGKYEYSVGIT
jgi:hypothetical protein